MVPEHPSPALYRGGPDTPHDHDLEDSSKSSPNQHHRFPLKSTRSRVLLAVVAVAAVIGIILALTLSSKNDVQKMTIQSLQGGDQGFFLKAEWDTEDASTLNLIIPKSSLMQPFIVHSIFNRGTIIEGETPDYSTINSMPVNNEVFHFELSLDQKSIKYVREQFSIRSSDEQMKSAMERGTFRYSEYYSER